MGMSASQMRYVMITGKQNDVEFQGQQINQQRTTLATESSAYNTQLLTLVVPTPPSSDDYVKSTYTFSSNGENRTVTGTQYQNDGTYVVTYTANIITSQGQSSGSSVFSSTVGANPIYTTTNGTVLTRAVTNPTAVGYSAVDASNVLLIKQDCGLAANANFFKYTSNGVTKYVPEADLATYSNTNTAISTYFVNDNASVTKNAKLTGCTVDWNESGRMTAITDSNNNTYTISVTSTNDQAAYTDAMNEYEFKKGQYEQEMNSINAKIEIIQQEDKKLELKLTDLDTQQKALSNELESVKKVVDKNVEVTFKTFA